MYLIFDTETNGLPVSWKAPMTELNNWPRVVQLAWALFDEDGTRFDGEVLIIKPDGFTIPKAASDVHGITDDFAFWNGVELPHALTSFLTAYSKADTLVAHNIAFDYPVLGAELLRTGLRAEKRISRQICTMKASVDLCRLPGKYGYKWPKLEELHMHLFGETFDGAHDAMVDVEACARCLFELKRRKIIV